MTCYRLTCENERVFEIEIECVAADNQTAGRVWKARLYRVEGGARAATPFRHENGEAIQIRASTERTALRISRHVLQAVMSSPIVSEEPAPQS